ncbi:MAG: hypothetical protein JWO53_292 [Chlamydiia bacterium]|nr:hypothetical protein [Chlamydiia bacterium]
MVSFILWNFVNLIDAEGGWFVWLITTLVATFFLTSLLKRALHKLHQKFQESHQVWKDTFVTAIQRPVIFYIWFAVLTHLVNLISDQLISDKFLEEIKLIFSLLAVLTVSWFLVRWKTNLLNVLVEKQKTHEIAIDTGRVLAFGKLATAAITVVTILLLMEVTGQNFKTLVAFGGISGLALAIASQEIIGNFFGGFMIYVNRPFGVGDFITLPSSHLEGHVEDIGWYQTCLRGTDKKPVYIPNALFSKAYVVNGSRMTHRKLCERVSLRHEDLFKVPEITQEILTYLENHPGIDSTEKVMVNMVSVGPYSVDIQISALSDFTSERKFYKLRDEIFLMCGKIIKKHGARLSAPMHRFVENYPGEPQEEPQEEQKNESTLEIPELPR